MFALTGRQVVSPSNHNYSRTRRGNTMWDTVTSTTEHLSHDRPCVECGHGQHTYLPCSDTCSCVRGRVLLASSS